MYVFDFDKTIYNGDSSIDFYKFCLKKNKKIIKYLPRQLFYMMLYIIGKKSKKQFKEIYFSFLKSFENIDEMVNDFWKQNKNKIKKFYLKRNHSKDVIISASPRFLLEPICNELGIKKLLATEVNSKNGKFEGENCYGTQKVKRYKEEYPDEKVIEFYTDSLSDMPMINISKTSYIVKKDKIIKFEEYKISKKEKIMNMFTDKKFILFIIVGCINAINGILLSTLYSIFLNSNIAFILGYLTSLFVSYLLNSYITFKDKNLTINKFIKFCISYIPNFLVQLICVLIFINIMHINKIITYTIAAIIGVPITYLLLVIFTFKKNNKGEKNEKLYKINET